MKSLGAELVRAAGGRSIPERQPITELPLERILAIPHTLAIQARLAMLVVTPSGEGVVDLQALMTAKEHAEERDVLAATRPDGCWCYGRGGIGERAVLVAGQDVPMVLGVYCTCSEGEARQIADAEVRERGRAYAQEVRLLGIWESARVPERFTECSFLTFPATPQTTAVIAKLQAWLESPEWAIVLLGQFGVGKTGLAISALREAAERKRQHGLFVKTPDLLARIRATYGKSADVSEADVLESLRTVDYLVLDDVGAEHVTDWATSMLFQVLDDRHDHQRKTILTTNLDIAGLGLHMGERTMHRFEEGAEFLTVNGPNLRVQS